MNTFSTWPLIVLTVICLVTMIFAHEDHLPTARFGQRTVCGAPLLASEETAGPYPWNTTVLRRNITEGQGGLALNLQIQIIDINTCLPLSNDTAVEIWHCNATGSYSHYDGNVNSTWLRGIQSTNAQESLYLIPIILFIILVVHLIFISVCIMEASSIATILIMVAILYTQVNYSLMTV